MYYGANWSLWAWELFHKLGDPDPQRFAGSDGPESQALTSTVGASVSLPLLWPHVDGHVSVTTALRITKTMVRD